MLQKGKAVISLQEGWQATIYRETHTLLQGLPELDIAGTWSFYSSLAFDFHIPGSRVGKDIPRIGPCYSNVVPGVWHWCYLGAC